MHKSTPEAGLSVLLCGAHNSEAPPGLQAALGLPLPKLTHFGKYPLFQKINLSFGNRLLLVNLTSPWSLWLGTFRSRAQKSEVFGICDLFARLWTLHLHLARISESSSSRAWQGSACAWASSPHRRQHDPQFLNYTSLLNSTLNSRYLVIC